jgi:hypothetical protein
MPHRLISADDHVDLSHDTIKSFLDPKYHDAYNQALRDFGASTGAMRSNESNQRWREQQGYQGTGKVGMGRAATASPAGPTMRTRRRGSRTWTPTACRLPRRTAR